MNFRVIKLSCCGAQSRGDQDDRARMASAAQVIRDSMPLRSVGILSSISTLESGGSQGPSGSLFPFLSGLALHKYCQAQESITLVLA